VADCFANALARLRHAAALEQRAERLHARFEHAPVAMLVVGARDEIVDANAAARALLGRDRDALVRLPLAELPDGLDLRLAGAAEAAGGERVLVLRDLGEAPTVLHTLGIGPGVPTPL
jgi:PAS domain-containing protein